MMNTCVYSGAINTVLHVSYFKLYVHTVCVCITAKLNASDGILLVLELRGEFNKHPAGGANATKWKCRSLMCIIWTC